VGEKVGFVKCYISVLGLIIIYLVTGVLKGYDQLMNLVLDDVKEIVRSKLPLGRAFSVDVKLISTARRGRR